MTSKAATVMRQHLCPCTEEALSEGSGFCYEFWTLFWSPLAQTFFEPCTCPIFIWQCLLPAHVTDVRTTMLWRRLLEHSLEVLGWLATFRLDLMWIGLKKRRVKTMHERPAISLSLKKCVCPYNYSTISWRTPLPLRLLTWKAKLSRAQRHGLHDVRSNWL